MKQLTILTDIDNKNLVPDEKGLEVVFRQNGIEPNVVIWDQVDWTQFKNILVRSPWDYSSKSELFKSKINEAHAAGVNIIHSPEILFWNMDKSYLSELADKTNVVRTICVESFNSKGILQYFEKLGSTLVFKPKIGAGGRDTFKVHKDDNTDLLRVLDGTSVLVQPYISAIIDEGEYSFIYFNGEFSHSVLKNAKEGEFRVQDDHGGVVKKYLPKESELKTIKQMLESIPFETNYARVDVVRHEGTFYLMEMEIIEPELFFRFSDKGMERFAKALYPSLTS